MNKNQNQTKLGILVCGHSHPEVIQRHGHYHDLFKQLLGENTFDYQIYTVVDNHFPNSIHDADAWLITGSKHGAYEQHSWIPPLEDFIREAFAADLPIVGICFGHQILAQAMGGYVEKFAAGWSAGRVTYNITLDEQEQALALNAWHQDQVVKLPPNATVIGSSDFCQYAALLYGKTALSFQAHPEFEEPLVASLLEYRGEALEPELREQVTNQFGLSIDNQAVAQKMRSFLLRS